MIIVTVKDNSISITGHACRKESSGIDRACTAVSDYYIYGRIHAGVGK